MSNPPPLADHSTTSAGVSSTRSRVQFSLQATDSSTLARAGTLVTRNAIALTPIFMPVATHGVVRGQRLGDLAEIGFPILLANTYHLLLRPGCEVFRKLGGIRNFINWPNSVLTDSGGFQLFSLAESIKVTEEGATFTSYIDGSKIHLSPEESIATQRAINSDIMMVLDQVLPSLSDKGPMREAMARTHRWANRSLAARGDSDQALFGIVQGGCFFDLRSESAQQITSLPLDGYAIGGVAVGEEKSIRDDIVEHTAKLLPIHSPRYVMGVGTPIDLLEGVARGVDMFDCILPNALAEHGKAFTYGGRLNLLRSVYRDSELPIDSECGCLTCSRHSRAYLHQLLKASESSANSLIGYHNLYFFHDLMKRMRSEIVAGTFSTFYRTHKDTLAVSDAEFPSTPPKAKRKTTKRARGDYEVHQGEGFFAIKQISSGEVMHSVSNPTEEAKALYIQQTRFSDRVKENPQSPFVVWDVGLGAATNAMAAINEYEALVLGANSQNDAISPLHIISFENDLDSLALTLKNPGLFVHVRHPGPYALLKEGKWRSIDGKITWEIRRGDFVTELGTLGSLPAPDLIFYDPFSYKTNPSLWTYEVFRQLRENSRADRTALITYSASTAIRAGLLAAGFRVALGAGSGPKESTTVATCGRRKEFEGKYLTLAWMERWNRSDNKYPPHLSEGEYSHFQQKVMQAFH